MRRKYVLVALLLFVVMPGSAVGVPTTAVRMSGNLDASAPITSTVPPPASFQDLANGAQFSVTFTIRDSLLIEHTIAAYFFHTSNLEWVVQLYIDGGELGGVFGTPYFFGGTNFFFDSNGIGTTGSSSVIPFWGNGAAAIGIQFLFDPITQLSGASNVASIEDSSANDCATLATCIDQQLPSVLASCATSAPSCSRSTTDLIIIPSNIVDRAVSAARCDSRTFRNRRKCRNCYDNARKKIRRANSSNLFGEFLNQAIEQLKARRDAACG